MHRSGGELIRLRGGSRTATVAPAFFTTIIKLSNPPNPDLPMVSRSHAWRDVRSRRCFAVVAPLASVRSGEVLDGATVDNLELRMRQQFNIPGSLEGALVDDLK